MLIQMLIVVVLLLTMAVGPVVQRPQAFMGEMRVQEENKANVRLGLAIEEKLMNRYRQWGTLPSTLSQETLRSMGFNSEAASKIRSYTWDEATGKFTLTMRLKGSTSEWATPHSDKELP